MTRAPPPPAATAAAFLPASSPLPLLSPELPQNPWRINTPGGGGCAAAPLPLMGEPPSSWPALSPSFQVTPRSLPSSPDPTPPPPRQSISPPPTSTAAPPAADLVSPSSSDDPAPSLALTSPPPPVPLPPPANAAPAADQRPPPPRPSAPRRGGRNQRFHNNRGGGGGGGPRGNNSYTHRPPVIAGRSNSNWNGFGSVPRQPVLQWGGYFTGSPVGVVPPGDMTTPGPQYFVQFPQAYGELMYPTEYVAEPYYYEQQGYEVPYGMPMSPGVTAVITPPQPVQSFPVEVARDHVEVNLLKSELLSQIEYYFSDENLVRDTYLRRKMDSQGWVDVHVIAAFKRVESLTEDMGLIKDTLQSSNVIEIQGNKIRKRQEWHKWILQQSSSPSTLVTSMQNTRLGD